MQRQIDDRAAAPWDAYSPSRQANARGDAAGRETLRRSLSDWLTDMSLVAAGGKSQTDGFIGYMEPDATSRPVLDEDQAIQEEVRNVARARARFATASQRKIRQSGQGIAGSVR